MDVLNELTLIKGLKEGNEQSFRILVEEYRDRVYNCALHILQNTAEAEDAAQETFIRVFHHIHAFKGASSLSTWIYRITVNQALEIQRKKKNRQRLNAVFPWWMPDERKSSEAEWLNPGISAENKEKARQLFDAIHSLPERQKIAFTLIQVQGLSYEEAGAVMELGVKALESLISRSKENLRKKLTR
jgi:RNA polymerase sigma factor (sigma-70 family)